MWRNPLVYFGIFITGALAVLVPMFVYASMINADELARREQTMSPGITMFLGMLLSPLGGTLAVAVVCIIRWLRKSTFKESSVMKRH